VGGHSSDYGIAGDFDLIVRFGILCKPYEIPDTVIDYLGGGISERNPQVPGLLRAVRVDRLGIRPVTSELIGGTVGAINGLRRYIGTARRSALGALRRPTTGPQ
jgi:hypothetical protein